MPNLAVPGRYIPGEPCQGWVLLHPLFLLCSPGESRQKAGFWLSIPARSLPRLLCPFQREEMALEGAQQVWQAFVLDLAAANFKFCMLGGVPAAARVPRVTSRCLLHPHC